MSKDHSKYISERGLKLHEERDARIKQVCELIIESKDGLCAKDLATELKMSADTLRVYLKELLTKDLVYVAARDGKTRIYKWNANHEKKPADMIDNKVRTVPDGKDFEPDTFVPCGDVCRPGDIVWVSSRSGEGQFFRYLIITPWERKATVLGIFPEGHPSLNLNDPNYVYLGNDPETGEGLYADVTNNCSRGYKQFGELLMHVNKDCMDAVKNRLARVMQFDDICGKTVVKEIIKDDPKKDVAIERLKKLNDDNARQLRNYEITEKNLRESYNSLYTEYAAATAENKEKDGKIAALKTQIDEMDKIRRDLQQRLEVQCETIDKLNEDNARLRQEMLDVPVSENELSEENQKVFDALMTANADLEKDLKQRYEDEIKTLRQIIFSMINKGGDSK